MPWVGIILAASITIQAVVAVLALRLIRVTRNRWAWGMVALAIVLMIVRRGHSLVGILAGEGNAPADLSFEMFGLAISICMGVGIAGVAPVFTGVRRSEESLRVSQDRIRHLNQVLTALRNVDQLITREKDPGRLLQGVCDSLVQSRGYQNAWIALRDAAGGFEVKAEAAQAESPPRLRDLVPAGQSTPCVRHAIAQPAAVVIADPVTGCGDCAFREVGCANHAMAVQIRSNGDTYGVLVASVPDRFAIDDEERALFAEAAGDVAFALHSLRLSDERQQAEDSLRLDESRLEALVRLNQMENASLQQLTDFALEEAVRLTGSSLGYLAFMSEDETVLTMHSWSKTAMKVCAIIDKPIVYPVVATGLWGEAVRQRRPVITNDYAAPNPLKKGYPAGHVPVTRHMNAPVFEGDRVVLVAGVGNKTEPYDDADVRQLTLLMQGMWRLLQRKQAEQELRKARDELEARVQERTAELARANAELRQAKDAAEAGSRAKSTFLANMSHEIRTPLNAVIGMTELVLKTPLTSQQHEFLSTVRDSGEALLTVLNDILDFSKIEAGKLALEQAVFDLRESLGDTMKSFAIRAHEQGLELATYIHPDVPRWVVGDYGRLRQVIVNLVGNALKFTERGEVVLEVAREEPASGQATLHFTVTDTGMGIPAEFQASIFESFEQVDKATTRRHGGTGLGLAIASRLVDLMGGRIWVESTPGQGSRFHFTARLGLAAGELHPAPALEPDSLHGLRVLAVDDNGTNRRILEEILQSWRMCPATAANAGEALAHMRRASDEGNPFRLVLTDAHMPETDGFMLAEQIRKDPRLGCTVILMLTSGDRPEDLGHWRELGIAAHLLKPVKQSELLDAIQTALGGEATRPRLALPRGKLHARGLRILLAEDSPVNEKVARALLENGGHQVTAAHNGREAVALGTAQRFDAILMDVQMPEMDGVEATAAIREHERLAGLRTPIIAMTAYALKGDRERFLAAGMDDYVSKPIRAEALYQALDGVVASRAESPPAAAEVTAPVDWALALEAVGGDRNLLRDIAGAALEELPESLASVRKAVESNDASVLNRAAHSLKSSLRYLGAVAAAEQAFRMENLGREGRTAEAVPLVEPLAAEVEQVIAALRAFLATGQPAQAAL